MEHALSQAPKARTLFLEVRRSNTPAIRLYRSLGFYALGVRKKYYPDGEDAIEMAARRDEASGGIVPGKDEVNVDAE
jgi:ribosomal-protein-alanine N-acetyltransferase